MSYSYTKTERKRTTSGGGYGYSGNRSAFGYWLPLAITITAATVGLAAWVWGERSEHEEESSEDETVYISETQTQSQGYTNMSGALPSGPPPPGGFQGGPSGGFQGGPPPPGGFQTGPQDGMLPGPQQPGGFGPPPPPGGFQGPSPGGFQGGPPPPGYRGTEEEYSRSTVVEQQQETGLVARMSSVLGFGRSTTPSGDARSMAQNQNQTQVQSYDWTNKPFASATAAAGAVVGAAISTMSGGNQASYEDHERWSEEAEQRDGDRQVKQGIKRHGTADEFFSGEVQIPRSASIVNRKRKTVAVVVSAVGESYGDVGDHASVLSHLPEYVDPESTRVFVLIYAPDLKAHPLSSVLPAFNSACPSQSLTSSYSNISTPAAHTPVATPGDFPQDGILSNLDPNPIDESSTLFKTLYNQAVPLVDRDTMVLPFTSQSGHKHILRSLSPEVVYIQESLCGRDGEIVSELSGWVRQTVIVIGDEGGHGGLVDTDDEGSAVGMKGEKWWQKEERTGVGRRVGVVESLKVGEDWERRINEKD